MSASSRVASRFFQRWLSASKDRLTEAVYEGIDFVKPPRALRQKIARAERKELQRRELAKQKHQVAPSFAASA